MSLSRAALRPTTQSILFFRRRTVGFTNKAKVQLEKPKEEEGFFSYARNFSRDPKKARGGSVPQMGDLPSTFMFRRLGHAYEIYPLLFLGGFWICLFIGAVYMSFDKLEIWLDRSSTVAPWDWERIRSNYWKKSTLAFDKEGVSRKRCELMEMLQDEMVEAAKKRGTR